MKNVHIQIRIQTDCAPVWCLGIKIDSKCLGGVIREAAGLDGGAEWNRVELFVRDAVHTALINWADNTLPVVQRIRAERDLMYATLKRCDVEPRAAFARLENFARLELNAELNAPDTEKSG